MGPLPSLQEKEMEPIVQGILELAPPGEIKIIESDLRTICEGGDTMVDAVAEPAYRTYNQTQMISMEHEGAQVLLSEHGLIDGNRYLDPRNKKILTIDHAAQSVSSAEPADASHEGANAPLRSAIDEALLAYVADMYPKAASAVYPNLAICISSGLFAPTKFWNGRWMSNWQYADGKLNGSVKVHVHYFEKGNVHKNISFTSPQIAVAEDAPAIVKAIAAAELNFHRAISEEAAALKESFKSLRRGLPVTKKEIDWKKIQSEARVGKELGGLMQ